MERKGTSGGFGSFGLVGGAFKPITKCAGLGGNSSSIAAKKA